MTNIKKCLICGKPYTFYNYYVGDQTYCPECRAEAKKAVARPSNQKEIERRRRFFWR